MKVPLNQSHENKQGLTSQLPNHTTPFFRVHMKILRHLAVRPHLYQTEVLKYVCNHLQVLLL